MFVTKKSYTNLQKELDNRTRMYEDLIHTKASQFQDMEKQILDLEIKNRNLNDQLRAMELSVEFLEEKIGSIRDLLGIYPDEESRVDGC